MLRLVAVVLTSSLLLAGCGSSEGGLDDVEVGDSADPSVTVAEGFETDSTDVRVLNEGNGVAVEDGDLVKVNYVAVNGRTGEQFDNSFTADKPMTVPLQEGSVLPGFVKGLTGQKIGSRVLVAIPPRDGFGQAQEALGIQADDSMVFLFDLVAKVPDQAEGDAQDLPDDVPEIVEEDGRPSGFEPTDDTAEDVQEAQAYVAVEGEGDPIEEGQSITAQYVGQVYPDGEVFDESWSGGSPATFQIGQLVQCWQDLIPGQTLGSRVVLVCPADTAYGDDPPEGGAIEAGDTLIFAIDLLDAS